MSVLTSEQIEALNAFARTHPHLAKVFDYTLSGTKEGLGDALNDSAASSTEAVSLGGDVDIFESKVGSTLRFRGLSAGSGIELTENANDVQVASTVNGGGFYGIVVKDDNVVVVTDSIEFSDRDFDVFASGDGALVELDDIIRAEAFYLESGGNIYGDNGDVNIEVRQFIVESNHVPLFYLDSDFATFDVIPRPISTGKHDLGTPQQRWQECFGALDNKVFISSDHIVPATISTGTGNSRGHIHGLVELAGSNSVGTLESSAEGTNVFGGIVTSGTGQHVVSLKASGIASFAGGIASASGSNNRTSTIQSSGDGSFAFGSAPSLGAHDAIIESSGAGSFAFGFANNTAIKATNSSFAGGAGTSTKGSQAQIISTGLGSFAYGAATSGGTIQATETGSVALGASNGPLSLIESTGFGALALGRANSGTISASGAGSVALGNANVATIAATADGAIQIGEGTNAVPNSIQILDGFAAGITGYGNKTKSITLGPGDTTFAVTSSVMTITGDPGTNTIATITGAFDGQFIILIFTGGLVTIFDDNSHAADTIDLSGPFVGSDDATLTLIYDGVSWYELSRSNN